MTELSSPSVGTAPSELQSVELLPLELLLSRVAAGDPTALGPLYAQTAADAFRTARSILHDFAQAEEVTQEVFVQLWQSAASRFDPARGRAQSYVMALARRRAIDRVRLVEATRRHDTILGARAAELQAIDMADTTVTRLQLHAAVNSLGENAVTIIALYYLGHTYHETAALLDIPIGTVKSRHHRALAALREIVDTRESGPIHS